MSHIKHDIYIILLGDIVHDDKKKRMSWRIICRLDKMLAITLFESLIIIINNDALSWWSHSFLLWLLFFYISYPLCYFYILHMFLIIIHALHFFSTFLYIHEMWRSDSKVFKVIRLKLICIPCHTAFIKIIAITKIYKIIRMNIFITECLV